MSAPQCITFLRFAPAVMPADIATQNRASAAQYAADALGAMYFARMPQRAVASKKRADALSYREKLASVPSALYQPLAVHGDIGSGFSASARRGHGAPATRAAVTRPSASGSAGGTRAASVTNGSHVVHAAASRRARAVPSRADRRLLREQWQTEEFIARSKIPLNASAQAVFFSCTPLYAFSTPILPIMRAARDDHARISAGHASVYS